MKLLILMIFTLFISNLEARVLNRSAHGLLMGDAYTQLATDSFTLFYNPALLARHQGFSFWSVNPQISVTNPMGSSGFSGDLGDTPSEIFENISGNPIHMGLGASPGFKMGKFGLTAILNNQTDILLQNQITPMLDIDHRYDRGFIMGYAHPLMGNYSSQYGGEHFAIGASVKYIQRESIYGSYNLTSPNLYNAIDSGDIDAILDALGRARGSGWGFDLGFDYAKKIGQTGFSAGLAILDAFTYLETERNDSGAKVQQQNLQANLGVAWSFEVAQSLGLVTSADIRNIQDAEMEFQDRLRLGLELKLSPALSLMTGYNSGQYSYGMKLNTGIIKIFGGFYDENIGARPGRIRSERAVIHISLFDFTFDG